MNKFYAVIATGIAAVCLANLCALPLAQAQERRRVEERRGEERRVEERREERFASPHWVYDARYNHGHYYPSVGYSLLTLPGTRLAVNFGARHLFFNAGVWFEPVRTGGYVVVPAPLGAVVPVLPPAYATVPVPGGTYYYANETYYAPTRGGFVVVAPPPGATAYVEQPAPYAQTAPQQPAPPPPGPMAGTPAPAAPGSGGVWYYCTASKSYYPYVAQCAEGWKTVPATPPGAPR